MAHLDLQWLHLFVGLYETRSVSRAAERLGLSQPNASIALKRLRQHFGDPLFCRTSRGMAPTARAQALYPELNDVVLRLARALSQGGFEPERAERMFRLAVTDVAEVVLLPPLLAHLSRHAPGLTIEAHKMASDSPGRLESGEIDLAIGFMPQLDAGFYQQALFSQDFVCIVSARHPRIGARLTKARYCAEGHVVITSSTRTQGLVDKSLAAQGLRRRVVMHVPTFLGVARIAAGTDLIVTTPRLLAQTLQESNEVRLLAPPLPLPTYDVKQHWHERLHVDPASMWLRQAVAAIAAEVAPARRGR
jgi:DNA-binding transcriptional LysR family regulator